jgi:hypothetical protein
MLRSPGSKRVAQKIEALMGVGPSSILILAVDNLGLLRVELQSTRPEPLRQLLPQALRLRLRPTVTPRIIGITFARDVGMVPRHPRIERVMHEEVRPHGAQYTSYKVAKNVVECATSSPREALRPGYGAGFLGAPLTLVKPDDVPTKRERGGRHGTSRPEHVHDAGDQRRV